MFLNPQLEKKIINTMLEQVRKERIGEDMDRVVMLRVGQVIDEIDDPSKKTLYEKRFEVKFLAATKEFY